MLHYNIVPIFVTVGITRIPRPTPTMYTMYTIPNMIQYTILCAGDNSELELKPIEHARPLDEAEWDQGIQDEWLMAGVTKTQCSEGHS